MNSQTIKPILQPYCQIALLAARIGGAKTEAVLHDLSDPLHSVVYVVNGHVTDRQVGQSLRHLIVEMLVAEAAQTDLLPDWWFRYRDKLIRCTTLLIRDEKKVLAGALCVNVDVTDDAKEFERIRERLPGLSGVEFRSVKPGEQLWASAQTEIAPSVSLSAGKGVGDAVCRMIEAIAKQQNLIGGTPSAEKRRAFVQLLNDREIFLVKGALEFTAKVLGVAKVTIYSDLNALRQEEKK